MKPHEHTQGCTDEQLGPRIELLPYEPIYDDGPKVCKKCGFEGYYPDLVRTILVDLPIEISRVCADHVACLRRRRKGRYE